MITSLECVESKRPFYRFSVLVSLYGQQFPLGGFIYRPEEGVEGPWVKFGTQGAKGTRTFLLPLPQPVINLIQQEVERALRPVEEHNLDAARVLYADDPEACRKLYPQHYRGLFIASSDEHLDMFLGLDKNRLWPDEVLEVWVKLTKQGLRDAKEIVLDYRRGLTSKADYERLVILAEGE